MNILVFNSLLVLICSQLSFKIHHMSVEDAQHFPHSKKNHNLASHTTFVTRVSHTSSKTKIFHNMNLAHNKELKPNFNESYKINAMGYYFTLDLNISKIPYKLNIDTGSSDLWIKGNGVGGAPPYAYSCDICPYSHPLMTLHYTDGPISCYETKLEIELAGKHKFWESVLVAYRNTGPNFKNHQGIIGLSFPTLARNSNPTFLEILKKEKMIKKIAFGVNLNFQNNFTNFIVFGSPNNFFYEGDLFWSDITDPITYKIHTKGVSIGEGDLLKVQTALFDTGNTCISVPALYASEMIRDFKTENGTQNNCTWYKQPDAPAFSVLKCKVGDFNNLPAVKIHIGGRVFEVEKESYLVACNRRPNETDTYDCISQGHWYCDTRIESYMGNKMILGDGFFNRYYTHFDMEEKKIGIAKHRELLKMSPILRQQVDFNDVDWSVLVDQL